MSTPPETPYSTDLISRVRAIHRHLDEAGFPHAFGGAIALGVHVEPRATSDIDINVIASPDQIDELLAAMPPGVVVPGEAAAELRHFKMLFNRRKDWADVASMIAAGVGDTKEAAQWIADLVGPDDERLRELADILVEQQTANDPPEFPADGR